MDSKKTLVGISIFVVLVFLFSSLFTVYQGQHAILLRLGRLVIDSKTSEVRIFSPG
jgi:membrane protease subunit HflC